MFPLFLVAILLPLISAQDIQPCDAEVKVVPTTVMKGGIAYTKLMMDTTELIKIKFPVDELLEIDKIKWRINGNPIDVDKDEDRAATYWTRDQTGVTLVIRVPKQYFIGNWEMIIETEKEQTITQSCQLQSPPMLQRFLESFRSTEGYKLTVLCKSASHPAPTSILWFRAEGSGDTATLIPVTTTEKTNIEGDTLVFEESKMSDTGTYVCNTTLTNGLFDSSVAEVKIKSRLAALWPFIGILLELIILLVTIILYERHKAAKKKADAAATGQADSLLTTPVSPSGDAKSSSHHGVQA